MARWIRIETPDWNCEARCYPRCERFATWEEYRTTEQVRAKHMPELRCDQHLPTDAEKITTATEEKKEEVA